MNLTRERARLNSIFKNYSYIIFVCKFIDVRFCWRKPLENSLLNVNRIWTFWSDSHSAGRKLVSQLNLARKVDGLVSQLFSYGEMFHSFVGLTVNFDGQQSHHKTLSIISRICIEWYLESRFRSMICMISAIEFLQKHQNWCISFAQTRKIQSANTKKQETVFCNLKLKREILLQPIIKTSDLSNKVHVWSCKLYEAIQ